MINLEKMSGLPIEIGEDYKLRFKSGLPEVKPSVRKFSDVVPVLMDQSAKSDRDEMYYMYRDVHFPEHEEIIRKHNIRYDITVIPPAMIGKEFNKTVGHYHPPIGNSGIAYPEAYEVIHGECLFLIQKLGTDGKVSMAIAIHAKTGDKVIYPPNYGHVMVNIGNDVLVTSNWVADNFESDYKPIADMKGMAYYAVRSESKLFEFLPNQNYIDTPAIRLLEASSNPGAKMLPEGPMYPIGVNQPNKFDFLNYPAKFAVELSTISS
jgi:glucose-6-phosphate isomerase, archaeal